MKKITLFVAALMASAAMLAAGTFKVEKVWGVTENVPGNTNLRHGIGWDGKIYFVDKGELKVKTLDNTGAVADYATVEACGVGITVDGVGNLIVKNDWPVGLGSIQICKNGEKTFTTVKVCDVAAGTRADNITASGDVYSEEGGYVYIAGKGYTGVLRAHIAKGAFVKLDTITTYTETDLANGNISAAIAIPTVDGNYFVHPRSGAPYIWNVTNNATEKITLPDFKSSTIGACTFELGGKVLYAYCAGTTNYSTDWNLYNLTDEALVNDGLLNLTDKAMNGVAGYNTNSLNCEKVDEYTVNIYQAAPTVAAGMWKVTYTPGEPSAVENNVVAVKAQKVMIDGQVYMVRDGKTFNMLGQEVK